MTNELEMERLRRVNRALEYENARLKRQLAESVSILDVERKTLKYPKHGRYLIGMSNGDLTGTTPADKGREGPWVRPVKSGGLGNLITRFAGPGMLTVYRVFPWLTLDITKYSPGSEHLFWLKKKIVAEGE